MLWNDRLSRDQGPYSVQIKRFTLTDNARVNDDGSIRDVPIKIIHPNFDKIQNDNNFKCPLIIWSHGYGGSQNGASFIARYLASYGYIIVQPTHFGTDSSIWEGQKGHPWDILKNHHISRTTTLNRYKDISFILDTMPKWIDENPEIGDHIDLSKSGISGHSFGAITTQVTAGQLTPDENGTLINLRDDRFQAAIAYSPVPGTSHLSGDHHEENSKRNIYETIQTPLLHMTGTEDSSPVNDIPYTNRLQVYDQSPENAPKALLIKKGGDHMVYNGTRGKLDDNPFKEQHEEIIKVIALAWWEYWLRDDQDAYNWMTGQGLQEYLGNNGSWKSNLT